MALFPSMHCIEMRDIYNVINHTSLISSGATDVNSSEVRNAVTGSPILAASSSNSDRLIVITGFWSEEVMNKKQFSTILYHKNKQKHFGKKLMRCRDFD